MLGALVIGRALHWNPYNSYWVELVETVTCNSRVSSVVQLLWVWFESIRLDSIRSFVRSFRFYFVCWLQLWLSVSKFKSRFDLFKNSHSSCRRGVPPATCHLAFGPRPACRCSNLQHKPVTSVTSRIEQIRKNQRWAIVRTAGDARHLVGSHGIRANALQAVARVLRQNVTNFIQFA